VNYDKIIIVVVVVIIIIVIITAIYSVTKTQLHCVHKNKANYFLAQRLQTAAKRSHSWHNDS